MKNLKTLIVEYGQARELLGIENCFNQADEDLGAEWDRRHAKQLADAKKRVDAAWKRIEVLIGK